MFSWWVSSLYAQCVAMDSSFLHADSRLWSDWADGQANLGLRSCSKLTMSFVNVPLKFWSLNMAYILIFLLLRFFSAKIPVNYILNLLEQFTFWPVVQSVVSLTSSLRIISLTVLADSIYKILIFFAEKMWVAFALQKLLTFFQQKKISIVAHHLM